MHYKTRSLVTMLAVVVIMVGLAFTVSNFNDSSITGAVTADQCTFECRAHIDCNDNNDCTEDLCINPYECNSYCEHTPKPNC